MESCLTEADKLGSQSIAFPALGTGAQNFPASIVAESMFSCVSKYCVGNKDKTSIKSVKFVVFHMDSEIHKVCCFGCLCFVLQFKAVTFYYASS